MSEFPVIYVQPCEEWDAVLQWLFDEHQRGTLALSAEHRADVDTLIKLCPEAQWTEEMRAMWDVVKGAL